MLIEDMKGLLTEFEAVVYLGFMPDSPDKVCVVSATGGYLPDRLVDGSKTVERSTFQVVIRDIDYTAGNERINAVVDALDGKNSGQYIHIFRQSDVLPLGKDEMDRYLFSVNFYTRYERSV